MAVTNGWYRADSFSVDREGFSIQEFKSGYDQWEDDEAVKAALDSEHVIVSLDLPTGLKNELTEAILALLPGELGRHGRIQFGGTVRNRDAPEWFDHRFRFKPADWGPANINAYVLAVTGGYFGDQPVYEGHVALIDRTSGSGCWRSPGRTVARR